MAQTPSRSRSMFQGMQCVKTGCHAYDKETQAYFIGDLYFMGGPLDELGQYVLKAQAKSFEPMRDRIYFMTTNTHAVWTMGFADWVFFAKGVEFFHYDGKPLEEAFNDQ